MKKFTLLLTLLVLAICANAETVTDVLTTDDLAATGSSYKNFSDFKFTSEAKYLGCTSKNVGIQLNTGKKTVNNVDYYVGIATSQSGGLVKKVLVEWNTTKTTSPRTLNVYGSNEPFDNTKNYTSGSTLVGQITYDTTNGITTELSISDDYAYVALVSKKNSLVLDKISIEWEAAAATQCANPTFSPASGTIWGQQDEKIEIALNCTTDGAEIKYSEYDKGTDISTIPDENFKVYNSDSKVELNCPGTYNIAAFATKDGLDNSEKVKGTWELKNYVTVSDIADFITKGEANKDDDYYQFGDLYVTASKGKYTYVRDNKGNYLLIYGSLTYNDGTTFSNGQIIPGVAGKYEKYNGANELTNPRILNEVSKSDINTEYTKPLLKSIANITDNDVCQYVRINGVKINSTDKTIEVGESSLAYYLGRFNTALPYNLNGEYDAIGIVELYNGNPQLAITEFVDNSPKELFINGTQIAKKAPYTYEGDVELAHGNTLTVTDGSIVASSTEASIAYALENNYSQLGTEANLVQGGTGRVFWTGKYTATIDLAAKTVKLASSDAYPAKLRVVTNFEDGNTDWTYTNTEYCAVNNEGVYVFTNVPFVTPGKFIISADYTSTDESTVNDWALGSADAVNNVLESGGSVNLIAWGAESPIQIKTREDGYLMATYDLTVDLNNHTITSTIVTGIEEIEADGAEIAVGEGSIGVAGGKATIYNAAGQTVATANNAEVAVPAGLYIVKVNGKATKVIVK